MWLIFTGWVNLAHDVSANPMKPRVAALSAFDIPASKNGLLACEIELPSFLQSTNVIVRDDRRQNQERRLSSIVTPAGTITDIHQDRSITGTVLFVTLGTKVLLTWPPTPDNLEFYEPYYEAQHGIVTVEV